MAFQMEYFISCTPLSFCLGVAALALSWLLYINRDRKTPPGPLAFPIVGNLHVLMSNGGNVLKTFRQLRSTYGDLFSLKMGSFDAVVVNGYDNLKELLLKRGDEVSDRPSVFVFTEISKGQGLAGSSGPLWKSHRTFALKTLRNFGFGKRNIESRIMEEVTVFLQEIDSKNGIPFDLDGLVQTSISNIVCSIVFGQRFAYTDKRFTKLLGLLNTNFRLVGPSALISVYPFLRYFPGDPFKGQLILRNVDEVLEFLKELVEEHRQTYDEDNIRDYIDAYLKEQQQNRDTFTDSQLGRSIADLFVAGTETTSTAIKWAILYLIHNEDVQNRMRKELDEIIGTSRHPSLSDRDNLPYCEAVITEILRCGNIAPLSVQHACNQNVSYRGFTMKKGSIIIPNIDSVVNDPCLFSKPDVFDPERFLDGNGKLQGQDKVIAFSIGRRICLGESLARSELFLYLTSMIQRFRFKAKDGKNLPSLEGVLGLTYSPKPFELCAVKRV